MSFMIEAAWTSSPAKRRKMPSKSLPTTELREEDDWTRVKDPKEKKRIQNRVAQRTYRTYIPFSVPSSLYPRLRLDLVEDPSRVCMGKRPATCLADAYMTSRVLLANMMNSNK
jgi:hypothetical protein